MLKDVQEKPVCNDCGKELAEDEPKIQTPAYGLLCKYCWSKRMGDLVEKHPIWSLHENFSVKGSEVKNPMLSLFDEEFRMVCWDAYSTWGLNTQLDMAIQECAELIHAICKLKLGQVREGKVAEEGIDVLFMLGQLVHMVAGPKLWREWYQKKMKRLKELLAETHEEKASNELQGL